MAMTLFMAQIKVSENENRIRQTNSPPPVEDIKATHHVCEENVWLHKTGRELKQLKIAIQTFASEAVAAVEEVHADHGVAVASPHVGENLGGPHEAPERSFHEDPFRL